ncbi:hypothetical protein JCM10212_000471 [Sporobolomyces blumeae]
MPRSSTLLFSSAVALFATRALAAAPTVSSPYVYHCTPTTSYQVTCDDVPCQVIARPSSDASQTLAVIGTVDTAGASTLAWKASVPAGTEITVYISDAWGLVGNNSPTTVAEGSGECGGDSSSSASGGGASSSTASSSSATGSSSSSTSASSASSSSSDASSSSSAAASSASSTSTATSSLSETPSSSSTSAVSTASGTAT